MPSLAPINDLQVVFDVVVGQLSAAGVECLLIGGFAVNYYGYTRNTLDVDWMIAAEQRMAVRDIMFKAGFTNLSMYDNVTFFNSPGSSLRVDFLHVDEGTMAKLLSSAACVTIQGQTLRVPALRDLLAMKFFALAQAPERRMEKDLPDIAYLSILNGLDLERDLRPLAEYYANEAVFQQVAQKIGTLQA